MSFLAELSKQTDREIDRDRQAGRQTEARGWEETLMKREDRNLSFMTSDMFTLQRLKFSQS